MADKKIKYKEPAGYIPKELRKKYGLGEYAEKETPKKETKKEGRIEKRI